MSIKLTAKEKLIMILLSIYDALKEIIFWLNILFFFLFIVFGGEYSITINTHHIGELFQILKKWFYGK